MINPRDTSQVLKWSTVALSAIAAALTLLLIWRGLTAESGEPSTPPSSVEPAAEDAASTAPQEDGNSSRPGAAKTTTAMDEAAKRVTQRNIWVAQQVKSFQLIGVLGNMALFQGQQPVAVGGTVDGAKVLDIGPDWVEIEYESRKQRLQVFNQSVPGGASSSRGGRPPRGRPSR